jgi:hypothetical protein
LTAIAASGEVDGVRRACEWTDDGGLLLLVLCETLFRTGACGISQLQAERQSDVRK